MNRYRIIDIEHIKSCFKSQIAAQKAIDQLVYNPLVLSEEESLARLKDVFKSGYYLGHADHNDRPEYIDEGFALIKKTL